MSIIVCSPPVKLFEEKSFIVNTNDPLMFDQRYPPTDNDDYLFSQPAQYSLANNELDPNASQGRRVYLESPSFGNKEEEDMYRYVQSRLTNRTASMIGNNLPDPTGATLMDSLDFDLDILGTHNTRTQPTMSNLAHVPRADPRQDPLLGPLLAELDAMSNAQQQTLARSSAQRPSVPSQPNLVQPGGSSNHTLTNLANRTVNDALFEAELNETLPRTTQQRSALPVSTPNFNSVTYTRPSNMDSTDIFAPTSFPSAPGTFLSHFGPEDQLFQRPLLNNLGQNYVPNPRPLPPPAPQQQQQQRDHSFDQMQTRLPPPQRTNYPPPFVPPPSSSNPFIEYERSPPQQQHHHQQQRLEEKQASRSQDLFFTDHTDDQGESQQQQSQRQSETQDQDSRRQAVWNEMQRTNAKAHEKNSKKHESANRNRAPFGSTFNWNNSGSQQSSALSKSPQRPSHHIPPPVTRPNHIDDNIDMIKNKENFYHRSPARKYENSFTKRKELTSGGDSYERAEPDPRGQPMPTNAQRHGSLPITVNLNTGDQFSGGAGPVAVPVDSHVTRVGDKISVNIDLRLVDAQNSQQQQGMDQNPQWSSGDPLDRHIRKLERNIEQTLPNAYPPQRSPPVSTTGSNPAQGRYSKPATSMARGGGYNPPVYSGGDYNNYNDRSREDDSYLSKLNYARKNPQFKPYTGRDYDQFKKNYGFGTGYLGSDFENTTHKERSDQLARTRQYAHQIEARNKKKLAESSRRTLSDTRLSKAPRPLEYPPSAVRRKPFSGKSTYSSPAILSEPFSFIPARRPTEVLYRPAPLSLLPPTILPELELHEPVEREKLPKKSALSSRGKPREEERVRSRRLSPTKPPLPPIPSSNKRRPVRFDDPPTYQQSHSAPDPSKNDSNNEENALIHQELSASNEQLATTEP